MKDNKSMLGKIVDLPIEEFKVELIKQKVNIGTLKNLYISLVGAYSELNSRKDNIVQQCIKGELSKDDANVKESLEGLYLEMMKIEEKAIHVKGITEKVQELDS